MAFYGRAVCHCGKSFDIMKAHKEIGPPELQTRWPARHRDTPPTEVWICERCGGIHSTVQEVRQVVRGPAGVSALLHANGKANGQTILTWQIGKAKVDTVEFKSYPRRFFVQSEPLIFQCWRLLMEKVDTIKAEPEGAGDNEIQSRDREIARHQARGIAETLAILMQPFCNPPEGSMKSPADMIVKFAITKHDDPDFQVPGLGEHLWDPTKNPDGSLRVPISDKVASTRTAPKPPPKVKVDNKSTRKLSKDEAAGVKEAVSSGMFSKEDVAAMFKVSMAEVEAAIS